MGKINNLVYFLNSMKDLLPFNDEKDFKKKSRKIKISELKCKN